MKEGGLRRQVLGVSPTSGPSLMAALSLPPEPWMPVSSCVAGLVHMQARVGAQQLSEAGPTRGEREATEELSLKDPRGSPPG